MSPEEQQRHIDLVRELSRTGGSLDKDGPNATKSNPAWFRAGSLPHRERRELHSRLRDEVRAQTPDAAQEGRALVLAGPPGAGKGRVAETILGDQLRGYVNVDADEFKKLLLRQAIADGSYESFIKPAAVRELEEAGEKFYPLELAALVHNESGDLAAALREDLIAEGTNLIVDTVLGNVSSATRLSEQLTQAGYTVTLVDVEVPYEVSEARIRQRWQEAMTQAEAGVADALGGRWVPSSFARPLFETSHGRAASQDVAERFAQTCPVVVRYERYFTSTAEHQESQQAGRPAVPVKEVHRERARAGGPLMSPVETETYRAAQAQRRPATPSPETSNPPRTSGPEIGG